MDEFRWIQMFLCLMLMIQIAVSVNETFIFMKVGDDVTLPCLNVIDDQNNCDGTTWIFGSRNKPTVELITLGQISEEAKTESDRLNVTVNCSLVIKKLRVEDVGRYYCQQYKVGQTPHTLVHQSVVLLSVIILTEHKDTNKVTLNCSVLTYKKCHHTVKWMIKGRHVYKDNNHIKTSQTDCSTSVTFLESHYLYSSRDNTVKCEVTDTETGRVQLFTFSPQPSGEETGDTRTTKKLTESTKSETTTTTTDDPSDWKDFSVSLRFIIVSVALAALLITAVTVNIWTRAKGNKAQMDKTTVRYDNDEDDVAINYENMGDSAASVRLH
ncbi:uncharacterized protein LOC115774485 [Archocentrus centrarchus]|uniref:uncharacterized protein LOC115774485 n=1 Tax=Archocentrus centrarchus TaxID=63155 RepID=UPI0011E9C6B2|nr:uncharacterized protein LOC115774485 [Archocentrus centrarchus]